MNSKNDIKTRGIKRSNLCNSSFTVDIHHNNKLNYFQEKSELLDKLKSELLKFKLDLKNDDGSDIVNIKDNIINIENKINDINKNNEVKYLTETGDILFNYYDLVDNGNNNDVNISNEKNNILKFFTNSKQKTDDSQNDDNNKYTLSHKYLQLIDDNYIKENIEKQKENCPYCNSLNREIITLEGIIYCNDCFTVEYIIVDHDRPTYKDPPREISYFSYKRLNHFNEWISQIQGKETTDISDDIYNRILLEIKKQKIDNIAKLTTIKMKEILKTLKLSKYYEHCSHIVAKINGIQTPQFSAELEDTLRNMFKQIQPLFNKYAPKNRKNFLSYSYVLYKMLQLLGKDEYLKYFPLLKSREKLQSQDKIWNCLCKELKWQFIKSI